MGGGTVSRRSAVGFVSSSSVRTDVLHAVAERPRTTENLIAAVDASESAVYDATAALERRDLLRSVGDGWAPTGSGRLVADLLEQQRNVCRLLDDDYWASHDVSALPRRFRLRLSELANAEVFRAPDTDPHAVVREVVDRVEAAGTDVDIVTPIYQAEYEAAMPDSPDARLVIDTAVAEQALARVDDPAEAQQFAETPVRVLDVGVGVGVTDDHLMLSLPTIDGQYDSRTEVLAADDRAIGWGRDLFAYYWDRARPAEGFVADRA
jgi:predicted transcriptional regulator